VGLSKHQITVLEEIGVDRRVGTPPAVSEAEAILAAAEAQLAQANASYAQAKWARTAYPLRPAEMDPAPWVEFARPMR